MSIVDLIIVGSSFFVFKSVGDHPVRYHHHRGDVYLGRLGVEWYPAVGSVLYLLQPVRGDCHQINLQLHRGCTVLDGWVVYNNPKVLLVLAKRSESTSIFRLVKKTISTLYLSEQRGGVYGEGFDRMK